MAEVDRVTARALVEVGYMPLTVYLERFAGVARTGPEHVQSPATVPDTMRSLGAGLAGLCLHADRAGLGSGEAGMRRISRVPSTS